MYPVKCTGTIARVLAVITDSTRVTSMQKFSLQSTKTGIAPISAMAPTVATNVLAAVITSSPGFIPRARRLSFIASVPLLTPIANLLPINFAKACSNSASGFPRVKSPVATNSCSLSHKSGQSPNC